MKLLLKAFISGYKRKSGTYVDPHVDKRPEAKRSSYCGWSPDESARKMLSDKFPPKYERRAVHVTARFGAAAHREPSNADAVAHIIGHVDDGQGMQALALRLNGEERRPDGKRWHMTLSTADNVKATTAADVLERGFDKVDPPIPMKMTPTATLYPHDKGDEPAHEPLTKAVSAPELLVLRMGNRPTPDQAESNVYKKPTRNWHGLTVAIEQPEGTVREGADETGKPWRTVFHFAYGEIKGTKGMDGDAVDVFVGMHPEAENVYIVQQMKRKQWDVNDEQKVMIDFASIGDAEAAYRGHYDDARFFGGITAMPVDEFIKKVKVSTGEMIKAVGRLGDFGTMPVLLVKSRVGAYMRDGKMVNTAGYEGRQAQLFEAPHPDLQREQGRVNKLVIVPKPIVSAPSVPLKKPHPLIETSAKIAGYREQREKYMAQGDHKGVGFMDQVIDSHQRIHDRMAPAFHAFDKHGDGTELRNTDGKRWTVLMPDATEQGKYRHQMFDERGFTGHSTHDTPEEAVADAAQRGYANHDAGALDRLAGSDEWSHGMAINGIIQTMNEGLVTHEVGHSRIRALQAEHDAKKAPVPVTLVSKKRVRSAFDNDGPYTAVELSDGSKHTISRLNSTDSMGLPGWRHNEAEGHHSFVGDNEDEAINTIVARRNRAAPMRKSWSWIDAPIKREPNKRSIFFTKTVA